MSSFACFLMPLLVEVSKIRRSRFSGWNGQLPELLQSLIENPDRYFLLRYRYHDSFAYQRFALCFLYSFSASGSLAPDPLHAVSVSSNPA